MKHPILPFERQTNLGIDRNDPRAAVTAIELRFPQTFCKRAWKVIRYFEGTMFLYAYKGKFVVTDESLELTECGDGTMDSPYGAPRWVGDSLGELEQWLLAIADDFDADAGEIPDWEADRRPDEDIPPRNEWRGFSANVMVKLVSSGQFIGVKTYCRKLGSHGRFLIIRDTLTRLANATIGETSHESDCGDYCQITRLKNSLQFSFAWLNTYGDGSVKGVRQDVTIPLLKIRLVLDWKDAEKHLYIPPTPTAKIVSDTASATIHEIVQNKRVRRAFSKAMRDCFRWPGDEVTLYRDGKYSFYFTTRSGFPKCGGLILHEGMRDGYPYVYYSVHT